MTRVLGNADWRELFNGNDLTGWVGDTNGYEAVDGMLVCKKGGGKNLYTGKMSSPTLRSISSSDSTRAGNNGKSAFARPPA